MIYGGKEDLFFFFFSIIRDSFGKVGIPCLFDCTVVFYSIVMEYLISRISSQFALRSPVG